MLTGKNFLVLFFILCSIPLAAQDKKPLIDISSSIRFAVTSYDMTGQDSRQEPLSFFLHGRPVLAIKGFDIPVSFIFSNHHKSFQQPFNRLGISPKYKWARVHLGYNTMQLSKYTFSNRQFLGAGVELNPGKFRIAALFGRLQAAVREDSVLLEETNSFLSEKPIPRFERRAIGGKIGFGTPESYFDIVGMRAYDVLDNRFFNDTTALRPQANTAAGIHSNLKLTKTLTLRMDVASSVYTRDTTSDNHELDASVAWIGNILPPKTSTQVLFAGEVGLGYKVSNWGIQVNYKRIDPDFKSMGVYYLQSDISQWTIAPQLSLLGKKLNIRSSFGIQQNNLYKTRLATNKRNIQSINMQWNPSATFQLGAFYSNFGLTQTPGLRQLTDSTRVSQVNSAYGLTPSIQWKSDTWQHQLIGTLSFNKLSFNKASINALADVKTTQFNGTYTLSAQQNSRFSVGGVFTWLRSDFGDSQTINTGIGGTGTLSAFKGKMSATALAQYFINKLDEGNNGNSIVINADFQYAAYKSLSFFLLGQLIKNDTGIESTSFTEKQMTLGLQVQF